jgi:hypothetical protein
MISLLGRSDNFPCPAAVWKWNWKPYYTFKSFIQELRTSFKDQNGIKTVHLRLTTTQQGNAGLTEFLQAFELNAKKPGTCLGNPMQTSS